MYKYRKIISIVAAMLVLFGALAMNGPKHIQAESPGVYIMPGNPRCMDLAMGYEVKGVTYAPILESTAIFGFKLEGIPPLGKFTYPLTSAYGSLTGGAPEDPNNSVTIEGLSNYDFNWWATLGIDAVIVKNAAEADVYVYTPEAFAGGPLTSGTNAISHIEFCYDYELTATKTAEAKVYKTIDWTITKDVTPPSASKFIGEDATFEYTVSVNKEVIFGPWVVEGTITVKNPTPWPVEFEVTDKVDGVPATVDCGGVTTLSANDGLAGGTDEVVCTYSISSVTEIANGSNVATVISYTEGVGGYVTKAVPFVFGEPILSAGSEPELITVSDSNGEFWSTGISAYWEYSETQTCSTDTALYGAYGFYSTDYNNTAEINETTGDSDSEKVTLTCYAPVVSKDADTEWKKKYDWTITKSVDPAKHVGFVGDEFTSYYDVVVDQTITDYGFKAFGKIYVKNPVGSPGSITVDVSDAVDGKVATVDCDGLGGTSLTVPTGETKSCGYTIDLADTTKLINTATVKFNKVDFLATADVIFGDPVIEGYPTINVTDSVQGPLGSANGDFTFEYKDTFTCSSNPLDYKDGFDSDDYPNTATITETSQSDDAKVTVDCYAPVVSKDADTEWKKKYDWTITKSVDPAKHVGFVGDEFTSYYDVSVDQTITDYGFKAFGKIYVKNPVGSPGSITVDVSDAVDGKVATVDCDGLGGTSLTVPTGETKSCGYTVDLADTTKLINTATVKFNKVDFLATADVIFGDPVIEGYPTINVTDSVQGPLGSANGDFTFEYKDTFTCSSNPLDYKDGFDSDKYPNTATITETSQFDDAEVLVDCYAPVVSKTANASYDETHTWKIEKSVDPTSQSGFPGDTLNWTWTVKVSESFVDGNFAISGTISVINPAPMAMDVILTDVLDDGTPVSIDSCVTPAADFVLIEGKLQVPAKTTATCYYSAKPDDASAALNTATATLNDIPFNGTAEVKFVANVINGTAVVDDDMETDFPLTLTAGKGPWSWTEPGSHTCSTLKSAYGEDGTYSKTIDNTATVDGSEQDPVNSSASTTYTCKAGFVDLLKLTDGLVNPDNNWSFALYLGPDGFGGTQVGVTSSTSGDADGILDFGGPALRPDTTYTICELGIAAGWSSKWWLMPDINLVPYNPDENNVPPEDLGNRCVDFGFETTIPMTVGETIHFKVDNSYPGGDPRTPGYWKNWNRCTGGGQQYTADANGGYSAGFWLLEDVLDPEIGGGIIWDDILIPDKFDIPPFMITKCLDAVNILDKRTLEGKKVASDPFHNLATHLLAAQLNFGAGACTTPEVLAKALEAETLLDKVNFNGLTYSKPDKKSSDIALANSLATYLDDYNNGMYCGSLMP